MLMVSRCAVYLTVYTGGVAAASLRSVQADYSDPLQPAALSSSSLNVFLSPPKTRRSGMSHISASSALSLRTINHHVPDAGGSAAVPRASRTKSDAAIIGSRALSPIPHFT